jgi:hypothetical protein
VRREEEYSYANKFLDKDLTFQPAGDEVVATFDPEETTDAADFLSGVDTARVSLVNRDRGFAVLQIGDEESTDGLALAVEGSEEIGNVLPVMIDGDSVAGISCRMTTKTGRVYPFQVLVPVGESGLGYDSKVQAETDPGGFG